MDISAKINESNGIVPNENPGACPTCNLKSFQVTLSELNDEVIMFPKIDWEALALCLGSCSLDCYLLSYCPPCYAACVLACTGLCYYLSTQ